jgi:YD repeat-containing protein
MKFFKFLLVFLIPLSVFAGVSLKNGNFYISYTDILVPGGGHDLKIVRTYNSRATEVGWFGFGWGSDYETYITVSADGSVVVHENGSGALTRFTPKEAVDPTAAANKIIEAMRKKTSLSEKVASNLRKKLIGDAEIRQAYARKFNVKAKLAAGTILYSNTRGLQEIHKVKKGFKRVYNDGKVEYFNKSGKLTKVKDKNNYIVNFKYDKSNHLTSIKDSLAKQLFLSWYTDGKIKEVWSAGDKKVFYKYKGDNLVQTKDVAGNIFKYEFDGHHNMTGIVYSDGSKKQIHYNKKTQFVTEVVDRNGESTGYKYDSNPKNPDFHYWTIVTKKSASGKTTSNRFEYEIKTRPDGSQYTYRIVTEINLFKTETIYSECCSLPLKITRGNHITSFEYNKKGLLTSKSSTKGDFVRLKYHKKFNKITRVDNNKGFTKFSYDKRGNLSKANNSTGKSVLLIYDRKGRIVKMVDQDKVNKNKKRILTFKYNALGKPVEIAMLKVGKINVAYDNYGEIKKVESKSGHKMALQVTQAFQSLLAIVKPAGVNLNM